MTWNASRAGIRARPATVMTRKDAIQPPIQSAALRVDCGVVTAALVAARHGRRNR